jgi:hypothetical protein
MVVMIVQIRAVEASANVTITLAERYVRQGLVELFAMMPCDISVHVPIETIEDFGALPSIYVIHQWQHIISNATCDDVPSAIVGLNGATLNLAIVKYMIFGRAIGDRQTFIADLCPYISAGQIRAWVHSEIDALIFGGLRWIAAGHAVTGKVVGNFFGCALPVGVTDTIRPGCVVMPTPF